MKTTTVSIFFNVNILVFSQFSRDFSHLTWVPWGVWTQPPGPHIGPYLLVSVTDGRISLLFDNFQKKSKIIAPYCARSKRTVLGQRAYRKIKTVFTRFNLCKLPSHYNLTTFWRQTLLTPIQLSMEGTSEVNPYDNRSQYIFMAALF